MALVEKPRRSSFRGERRPWMLKDYLKDDMSSCSSNGFRSFPRRQCCAAVKNLIEKEVIIRNRSKPPRHISRKRNATVSSALQRASMAVINAVKLLPFKSPAENSDEKNRSLPRSFSKKIFKRSFWKMMKRKSSSLGERKAEVVKNELESECDDIERWISSGVAAAEKYEPSDLSNVTTVTTTTTTTTSNSNSDGKSDSWSDITFTSEHLTWSSENDAVERREKTTAKDDEEDEISHRVGVSAAKSPWLNEASKKEQLSPISILEFPESDEGSLSPFSLRMNRLKGTQERLLKKLGRFESLVSLGLEPFNLGSLVSCTQAKDGSPKMSDESCSTPTYFVSSESDENEQVEEEEDNEKCHENEAEKRVKHLLKLIKAKTATKTSFKFDPTHLLLDYFQENGFDKEDNVLLREAEDWLSDHCDNKLVLQANKKLNDKREAYVRDIEGGGGLWPRDAKLEKDQVVVELGDEVLAHLIEESLQECCCS